jgi:hypothetical protein
MAGAAIKRQRLDSGGGAGGHRHGHQCWAHTRAAQRCRAPVEPGAVPYCSLHRRCGDGALRRVSHPRLQLGSALVARFALPAGYRLCFWGDRRPRRITPSGADDDRTLQFLSGRERMNPNGAIDPSLYECSLGQWMNAPGPSELATVRPVHSSFFGCHNSSALVGQEFVLTRPLLPNQQLAFSYSSEWWRRRPALRRLAAGCGRYPLPPRPRKRRAAVSRAFPPWDRSISTEI